MEIPLHSGAGLVVVVVASTIASYVIFSFPMRRKGVVKVQSSSPIECNMGWSINWLGWNCVCTTHDRFVFPTESSNM